MSLYGPRLLGKVDIVPGMFHVATKCWHINYVPLIPMKSYIVLSEGQNAYRHVEIPLSLKSLCLAWMRCVGWVAGIAGTAILILGLSPYRAVPADDWLAGVAIAAGGIVILVIAYKFRPLTHARYVRAAKLGEIANLNELGRAQLQNMYGVLPAVVTKVSRPRVPPAVSQGF